MFFIGGTIVDLELTWRRRRRRRRRRCLLLWIPIAQVYWTE
jgi:hypothetical protein